MVCPGCQGAFVIQNGEAVKAVTGTKKPSRRAHAKSGGQPLVRDGLQDSVGRGIAERTIKIELADKVNTTILSTTGKQPKFVAEREEVNAGTSFMCPQSLLFKQSLPYFDLVLWLGTEPCQRHAAGHPL
jgi:hypothetical protein